MPSAQFQEAYGTQATRTSFLWLAYQISISLLSTTLAAWCLRSRSSNVSSVSNTDPGAARDDEDSPVTDRGAGWDLDRRSDPPRAVASLCVVRLRACRSCCSGVYGDIAAVATAGWQWCTP